MAMSRLPVFVWADKMVIRVPRFIWGVVYLLKTICFSRHIQTTENEVNDVVKLIVKYKDCDVKLTAFPTGDIDEDHPAAMPDKMQGNGAAMNCNFHGMAREKQGRITVGSMVAEQAQEFADKPALIFHRRQRTYTFGELENNAREVAAGLIALGCDPQRTCGDLGAEPA